MLKIKVGQLMKPKAQGNITTTLISILVLLGLMGLGTWIGLNRPRTVAQPPQIDLPTVTVPYSPASAADVYIPIVQITGTYTVGPTATPWPTQPDPIQIQMQVVKPTATLTQKEEVVFDAVNSITMTLQPGLFVELPSVNIPDELRVRNFDLGEDSGPEQPINWIAASIGIGSIPNQESFEQFAIARRQSEVDFSQTLMNSDFQYGELEPFNLGQYHGFYFSSSGTGVDAGFAKNLTIYLLLENERFAQIIVRNTDSPDLAKVIQSLNTIVFAPPP